jgi:hypothetical protein
MTITKVHTSNTDRGSTGNGHEQYATVLILYRPNHIRQHYHPCGHVVVDTCLWVIQTHASWSDKVFEELTRVVFLRYGYLAGQGSGQKSKQQIMQWISFLIIDKSRLLYLRHQHHVQWDFLSTSHRCGCVSSSTRNNRNESTWSLLFTL